MQILRKELHQVAELWNKPIISPIFFLPHLDGTENYQINIAFDELEEFDDAVICPADVTDEFNEFATCVMDELGWQVPTNVKDVLDLYINLPKTIQELV